MSQSEDDERLFPPEWGWEAYEDATRELAAQLARYGENTNPAAPMQENYAFLDRSQIWMHEQRAEGLLPTCNEQEEMGAAYEEIWARLLADSKAAHERGSLTGGHALESVDLSEWTSRAWDAENERWIPLDGYRETASLSAPSNGRKARR